ncbi:hypothetical protein ACWIUD_02385 [Helicobacter sp. 23-1044]
MTKLYCHEVAQSATSRNDESFLDSAIRRILDCHARFARSQ